MNSNRVVLINPPVAEGGVWIREGRCQQGDIWGSPFPPFSLAMIASQLKKEHIQTLIIDSGPQKKSMKDVVDDCIRFNPEIAILSTATPTLSSDLGWFSVELKRKLPNIKIVATGIHVSALPERVLEEFSAVDVVIIGEPEVTSRELVLSIFEDKPMESVRGIAFNKGKRIYRNPPQEFIDDLDSLGFPDWGKIDFSNYLIPIKRRPFSLISFSRGCPFRCKFCATHAYNGRKLRKRSVDSLIEEIKYNLSFGVRDFLFWTELMTMDYSYLNEFLDAIFREHLESKIYWVCNSRSDSGDRDLFVKMRRAGCWQIAFGFEFGDDSILELSQKGRNSTTRQGRIVANLAYKAGIIIDGHFILGYPGETRRTLQKTIDYACSLPLTFAHFYAATPFPGSELYKEAVQKGWLNDMGLSRITQDNYCLTTETLNPSIVNMFIKKAYRDFYLRPRMIPKGLSIPVNLREYLNLAKLGLRFYSELIVRS